MAPVDEQAALLALVQRADKWKWHDIATLVEEMGGASNVLKLAWTGVESFKKQDVEQLSSRVQTEDVEKAAEVIASQSENGVVLLTVMEPEYPTNLRNIFNRPPFLFIRGQLLPEDNRSVAVVGTRDASERGVAEARSLARQLVDNGVTVLSGLAKGIDTAAHTATIEAGGRTVAVMGTGIEISYPKENAQLAERILESGGALVSQFWPSAPPTQYSFPMRNVVMSGLAIGTAVIEANSQSGAKMQARLALEHGKRLFLLESLVAKEEWARDYSERSGAMVVSSVDDIVSAVTASIELPKQLALS
jgi:DNA processing protein